MATKIGFPHTRCDGEPRPFVISEVCNLGGLPVTITMPSAMKSDDLRDFEEWIQLILRKVRRWSAAYEASTSPKTSAPEATPEETAPSITES
jgi:hypothetical protein